MISSSHNILPVSANRAPQVAGSAAKARTISAQDPTLASAVDAPKWTNETAVAQLRAGETNTLSAALPPIADEAQAAAATQHAGLLFQAKPHLALNAQANVSSHSVQRLLQ